MRWRVPLLMLCCLLPGSGWAAPGDAERGEAIYVQHCAGCHGIDGDGLGPGAERLLPPPRDFTAGMFKFMSTAFDGYIPQDEDIYEMIAKGMPGTAMPGWQDLLSVQDMWDLVAYIKTFPGYDEEEAEAALEYPEPVPISAESIARGRELFLEDDRCSECHGQDGKGDAIKRLLGDNGERTWPRNLTKPWTFRHGNDPRAIFTRISVGIPGTQMPSFADPASNKVLSPEQRWDVANYVNSLAKTVELVRPENSVIKSRQLQTAIPDDPRDPVWTQATPTTFFLVPQIIAGSRHFTPANDTLTVRSLYNDEEIALLLEWDDRTLSRPGDAAAAKLAEEPLLEDQVAVQLPVSLAGGMEKPYFLMGDKGHPVNLWQWRSGASGEPSSVALLDASGLDNATPRDPGTLSARGVYQDGTWRVLFRRSLSTTSSDDLQFTAGTFIPIAFAAWDGSNGESGSQHTLTTWYWLLLEPEASARPWIGAFIVLLLVIGLEVVWLRAAEQPA